MKYIIHRTNDDNFVASKFELNVEGVYIYGEDMIFHTLSQAIDYIKEVTKNASTK